MVGVAVVVGVVVAVAVVVVVGVAVVVEITRRTHMATFTYHLPGQDPPPPPTFRRGDVLTRGRERWLLSAKYGYCWQARVQRRGLISRRWPAVWSHADDILPHLMIADGDWQYTPAPKIEENAQ